MLKMWRQRRRQNGMARVKTRRERRRRRKICFLLLLSFLTLDCYGMIWKIR
jgi:hypothetical protein